MLISVASGKGGTGKTTVATNLAASLPFETTFLDCDVEEPNAHLFLNPDIVTVQKVYTPVPQIDENKCTYCRKCAEICRFKAIAVINQTILTFPELCHSCGGCTAVCPEDAVSEVGRELGEIEIGRRDQITFVHGRLRIGEAMSPPLIKKVREKINPNQVTIIDAPPGTSCPVIAAVKDADYVVMVTEPTPFGLHDLDLAVEAMKKIGLPYGIVINRADIGDDRVKTYARQNDIPILMEIPFERGIAEAYSRGELIIDAWPSWKEQFLALYHRIETGVEKGNRD